MLLPVIAVFVLTVGAIMGLYFVVTRLPAILAARRLDQRLRDAAHKEGFSVLPTVLP